VSIVFVLLHVTGDPTVMLLPMEASPAVANRIRHDYGLDQPLLIQYVGFLGKVARGDLGQSYRQELPVRDLVGERVWPTTQLALAGMAVAVLVGVPMGMIAAARRGAVVGVSAMLVTLVGLSVPGFWLGLMLILIFGVRLSWLPISGYGGLRHLLLPSIVLGSYFAAQLARLIRTSMVEVMAQDYVRTARAKGLSETRILCKHAFRNAILPSLTVLGLSFGGLLSGAVVTEMIFAWPGLGRLAVQAVLARDYPVVQGVVILASGIFLGVNLFVDLIYGWADPRIQGST
jgi:peptide/nickel transport system permease protein